MNWEAFYLGWAALATSGLALVSLWLVVWARRTFTQTEATEARKRAPFVSLMLAEPAGDPQSYMRYAREGQTETYWKWWQVAIKHDTAKLIRGQHVVTCFGQNIGEGPALRVVVPYRLHIFDLTTDGTETETDCKDGEFEVLHVAPWNWGATRTYLNVNYYPKWSIELLLDKVRVLSMDNEEVEDAIAPTTEDKKEGNNRELWEFLRKYPPPPPPGPVPPPP